MDKLYWYGKAVEASRQVEWFPTVILAQWQLETGNFCSTNLKLNNNIAGQTWTSQYPLSMRGSARPSSEGGYYVRYDDPVDGYVDFITRNPRYAGVREQCTEEGQIDAIARAGWAVDPLYAEKLIRILNQNREEGFVLLSTGEARDIETILKWYWEQMEGNKGVQDYTHYLAERFRKVNHLEEQ